MSGEDRPRQPVLRRAVESFGRESCSTQCVASNGVVYKVALDHGRDPVLHQQGGDRITVQLRRRMAGYWSGDVPFRRTWIRCRLLWATATFTRKRWPSGVTS
jgi:hypothetical protein